MAPDKELLLEEYKILEGRYRSDTNRIWSQAQILMTANFLSVTLLGSTFSDVTNRSWLVEPRLIIAGIAVVGFSVTLAWFLSLTTDAAYQKVSMSLLRHMEQQLEMPIRVFTTAAERQKVFRRWQRIGGATALQLLAFLFVLLWIIIFVVGVNLQYT